MEEGVFNKRLFEQKQRNEQREALYRSLYSPPWTRDLKSELQIAGKRVPDDGVEDYDHNDTHDDDDSKEEKLFKVFAGHSGRTALLDSPYWIYCDVYRQYWPTKLLTESTTIQGVNEETIASGEDIWYPTYRFGSWRHTYRLIERIPSARSSLSPPHLRSKPASAEQVEHCAKVRDDAKQWLADTFRHFLQLAKKGDWLREESRQFDSCYYRHPVKFVVLFDVPCHKSNSKSKSKSKSTKSDPAKNIGEYDDDTLDTLDSLDSFVGAALDDDTPTRDLSEEDGSTATTSSAVGAATVASEDRDDKSTKTNTKRSTNKDRKRAKKRKTSGRPHKRSRQDL